MTGHACMCFCLIIMRLFSKVLIQINALTRAVERRERESRVRIVVSWEGYWRRKRRHAVHNNNNNCILFAFIISFAYSLARNWQSFGCRPLKSKEGEGYPTDNSELPLTLRPSWIEIENRIIYYYPFIFFFKFKVSFCRFRVWNSWFTI